MYNTKRMKFQPGKISLVLVSLIVFAISAEFLTAKFSPQKTFRKAYSEAINCFLPDKTLLFTLKPNCSLKFKNFDTGEEITARTNNLGYRGEDFVIEKKPGEKRVLVEGDSFILGFGVSDRQIMTGVLEEKLRESYGEEWSVINAGYTGGFGPDGYYLHLKEKGIKLKPDLVVFAIFVYNDFSDMAESDWIGSGASGEPKRIISNKVKVDENGYLLPIEIPFIYKVPVLRNSNLAIMAYDGFKNGQTEAKTLFDKIRFKIIKPEVPSGEARDSGFLGTYYSYCIFNQSCHRKAMHLFGDLLTVSRASRNTVNGLYNDGNDHFLVLIIPSDFQIYQDTYDKYQADTGLPYNPAEITNPNPQERLKELFSENGIKYIDLLPTMREFKEERFYYKSDGHWNGAGHQMAAEAVYNWIKNNYVGSSSR